MDEVVSEFLVESYENLDQLDRDFVALEQDPGSRELLSSIFRTIHTIKGTSGFLAFGKLEQLTHVGEGLLSRLRDGEIPVTPRTTDVLLQMVDVVRDLLTSIEESGVEGDIDVTPVAGRITAVLEAPSTDSDETPDDEPGDAADEPQPKLGELLVSKGVASAEAVAEAVRLQLEGDSRQLGEILVSGGNAEVAKVEEALDHQTKRSLADTTVRVDVDALDVLMRLVGELVLTRNQVARHATRLNDVDMLQTTQRLSLLASELQDGVMRTRMQPIDHLWTKLPRVVRDLGAACGKQVDLQMVGRETELDKSLLEAVKDPLTHLVRNAVDHGIETPDRRQAAGKAEKGTLRLSAFHEGGQVVVEVADDGAGIDPAKVASSALSRGVVTRTALAEMSENEILELLFKAGFSTATSVTNVSGRGVGLDVVRTNIGKIGGAVTVRSEVGQGTTWRLTIPLTLAIVPALTVECAGQRYAVPQVSLVELVALDGERAKTALEDVSGVPVYRLRGRLLPLVRLDEALGQPPRGEREGLSIAVLQAEGKRFGLVVDRVLNTEEIVVKPLSPRLKGVGCYAGATLLGDGRVALILDVQALARNGLDRSDSARAAAVAHESRAAAETHVERQLVVGVGGGRRVAIPLDTVTRLEEFQAASVERVGHHEVVQYRGQILPLVRLASHLGVTGPTERETLPVVVYSANGRSVALVVDEIVDIAEEQERTRSDLDDPGLTGSAVIAEHVTELLDVHEAILAADPRFFDVPGPDLAKVGA